MGTVREQIRQKSWNLELDLYNLRQGAKTKNIIHVTKYEHLT